ncbi:MULTISPECIES: hypothetical protein [Nostoc]|uniref:Uncharacterized protein n=1 Tax=Nostoc foliaceum FACHB-393 TaxID=2692915 RepID=A0ABR8ILK5_9NOSO|nr:MULTISPECIES: hypothetical protein [Nostoc]MBD2651686.1 hypothetical protein [Nostoc foliaceum FACHB-393]
MSQKAAGFNYELGVTSKHSKPYRVGVTKEVAGLTKKNRNEKKPRFWGFSMKWDRQPLMLTERLLLSMGFPTPYPYKLFMTDTEIYFPSFLFFILQVFLLLLFRALDIGHQSMLKYNSVFWICSIRKENFFLFTHQLHFLDCVLEKMKLIATIALK